jgi:hypothetical protein
MGRSRGMWRDAGLLNPALSLCGVSVNKCLRRGQAERAPGGYQEGGSRERSGHEHRPRNPRAAERQGCAGTVGGLG